MRRYRSRNDSGSQSRRLALFGPPLLLEGEDADIYDELLAQVCAAVEPIDIIEEMYVADVISSEWEVLRWRRLKFNLLSLAGYRALEHFLESDVLEYDQYREDFEESLAAILRDHVEESEARVLARQYSLSEATAFDKIAKLGIDTDAIMSRAQFRRARELAQGYARRVSVAVKKVDELLASDGKTMDNLLADELPEQLATIERLDRLIGAAERRRDGSLHAIDKHRHALAEALRRTVRDVEDGEFRMIQSPAKEAPRGQ